MLRPVLVAVLLSIEFAGPAGLRAIGQSEASAAAPATPQGSWRKQFEDICSKTQEAMTLSPEDLDALVRRCDALQPRLEKLNGTQKKVYLGRLRMCRGLYAYVLESKKTENK